MTNYGDILRYQRENAKLSQPELAQGIKTSQANISRWERGEVLPNIDFCIKLAKFYGITLEELLGISNIDDINISTPLNTYTLNEKLSAKEKALLKAFNDLLPESQDFILKTIQSLSDRDKALKNS